MAGHERDPKRERFWRKLQARPMQSREANDLRVLGALKDDMSLEHCGGKTLT